MCLTSNKFRGHNWWRLVTPEVEFRDGEVKTFRAAKWAMVHFPADFLQLKENEVAETS